ncbi:MAG TPA: VCBS repeat-containing protein [Steroidobacteraceae bacterium]|jgi:hypothetical protein
MSQTTHNWRHWLLIAALPAFASCGGNGHCDHCFVQPPPVEEAFGLVAGTFSANGNTSVIVTSTVFNNGQNPAGFLKTYLSTGAGDYATPVLISDGHNPLYLATADLNGDHVPDVVSASFADGNLQVFLNSPGNPGTFAAPLMLTSPGASQVAIGDMNNDGLPDLVSADYGVSLFLQTAPGVFATPIGLYSGGANWVAVGDLNGDGIPDIALTDNDGVKLLMHTGVASASTYATPIPVFTQTPNAHVSGANIIAIADVNGDGFNDLIITDPGSTGGQSPTVSVLLQIAASPGTFAPAVSYPTAPGSLAQSIVVTDVNGDGVPDIVIGGTGAVSVLLQDPTNRGVFMATANYPAPNANEIAVADTNADGLVDIIVSSGATQPVVNGIITNNPGVLLQSATSPGTFGALQDLP